MVTEIPEDIRNRVYFHSTSNEEVGEVILKDGYIRPPLTVGKAFQSPVKGRVYLAQTKQEAATYAMGGVFAPGPEAPRGFSRGKHGYVFIVNGQDFMDIQPDEDSVGEMMDDALNDQHIYTSYTSDSEFRARLRNFSHYLTERQRFYMKRGDAIWLSHAGKRLLKHLPDWMKIEMIRKGANISHLGSLPIHGAFKFDRTRSVSIFAPEYKLFRRPQIRVDRYWRRKP